MNTPNSDVDAVVTLLAGRADVAEAAVVRDGARRVAAAVPRGHCAAADLRDHIWDTVAAEQLPDLVVVVPQLPRDPAGRVLAGQVAAQAGEDPGACGFAAPRTTTEVALAAVWRQVLGRRHVAADDDFFDLGGDSITATLLLDLSNERFGVTLSFDALLGRASLRAFAATIEAAGARVPT
jgi:acyl carrier protein